MQPAGKLRGTVHNLPKERRSRYPFFLALLPDPPPEPGKQEGGRWVWINDPATGKFETTGILPGKYRVELRLSSERLSEYEKIADLGELEIRKGESIRFDVTVP